MKIGIIGYGSFGTALSILLAGKGHDIAVAARNAEELNRISRDRENKKYLPGISIPKAVEFFGSDYKSAITERNIILFAVPSQHFREIMEQVHSYISDDAIVVNVAKGIEESSLKRQSEIATEFLNPHNYVALSGPSHAEEVGIGMPTSVVASSANMGAAAVIQEEFRTDRFRIYTNGDIIGVELGGALKNIMALGAGISEGLGFGDNAKAAMMTRGIAEISRLGVAMGAEAETFSGLAGIGDLIVTCTSAHSRNRRCGVLIGNGMNPKEAVEKIGMVVEGFYSCHGAYELAHKYGVEMPITENIELCLKGKISPEEAIDRLMNRAPKAEGR